MDLKAQKDSHLLRLITFYQGQSNSAVMSFVLASILYFQYRSHNQFLQHLWLILNFVISLGRVFYLKKFGLKLDNADKVQNHEKIYSIVLLINSIIWGAATFAFYPLTSGIEQFAALLFPIAILVGGLTRMTLSKLSGISYTLGLLITYDMFFVLNWSSVSLVYIMGGILFALFLIKSSKANYQSYLDLQEALSSQGQSLKELEKNLELEKELTFQKTISMQSSKLASLGEMAGGIAHEINNPLSIIKMQSDRMIKTLKAKQSTLEDSLQAFSVISDTVDRIGKIIQGLLVFSRDQGSVEKVKTKPNEIILEALSLTHEKFKSKNIEIKNLIDDSLENYIEINKIAIAQVIINLLNNSYYFIKDQENAWIEISSQINGDFLELSLMDSGKPLDPEISANLFTPFYTSKPVGEGTGLGLSISKSILKDHDGDIFFRECEHPCFVLRIPLLRK